MPDFTPTREQQRALTLFTGGESLVIEAGAGTGKTSTLRLLAAATPRRRGRYLAFNKAIVRDVDGTMPDTCLATTAHGLAYRSVGVRYAHRLNANRMRGEELALRLDVRPFVVSYGTQRKVLAPGYLAGVVMRAVTRFCQTADDRPTRGHVPYIDGIDVPDDHGRRRYVVNDLLAAELEPAVERAWADVSRVDGQLPFKHEHYLKLWQLGHPHLECDYILFDEAQDANPVMAAVVAEQEHAQRVYVGDANQAIYEWTGAVNSIDGMRATGIPVAQLSESFRFGEAIAARANEILGRLASDLVLKGQPSFPSTCGPLEPGEEADAVLCRTNAGAMTVLLEAVARDQRAHLVGGNGELVSFVRAAERLMLGEKVWHPELACFDSWSDVQDYVAHDQQGHELGGMVRLIDEFGVERIRTALDAATIEKAATVIVSTAHKAKGREWECVRIHDDFLDADDNTAELRLRYVACTRARMHLDDSVFDRADERPARLPAFGGAA